MANKVKFFFNLIFRGKSKSLSGKHSSKHCCLYNGLIDYIIQQTDQNYGIRPFVLQIGGNDGKTGDPIFESIIFNKLPALVVEPHPIAFNKLQSNYKPYKFVQLANLAISDKGGEMSFYSIADDVLTQVDKKVKRTALGVSSFSKDHVKRTLCKAFPESSNSDLLDQYIEKQKVNTISFHDLLSQYKIDQVDILQIDIEGFDYMIIENIEFKKIQPKIVNYESKNLPSEKRILCENILTSFGYKIFYHGGDTLAFKLS